MSSTILYRRAVVADVEAVTALLNELSVLEGYAGGLDPQRLAARLFGPARKVDLRAIVAVDGEKVIGVLIYYPGYDTPTEATGYHLGDMMISPPYQRRGVGRGIMAYVAEENLREGGEWVSFTVLESNEGANAFHSASGIKRAPVNFYAAGERTLTNLIKKNATK